MIRIRKPSKGTIVLIILIAAGLIANYFLINQSTVLRIDENYHYDQILRFVSHNYTLHPELTMMPGYHFVMSLIAQIIGLSNIPFIRFMAFIINLGSIPIFYLVAKTIDSKSAFRKTVCFVFFPVMFPYFALIYTDITSITFVLLGLLFMLRKRYILSGLFTTLSMGIRQNNIVIFTYFFLASIYEIRKNTKSKDHFLTYARSLWTYAIGFILFGVFALVTKGFVLSSYARQVYFHISPSNMGNVYFFFFVIFVLFIFENLQRLPDIIKLFKRSLLVILLILFVFAVYMVTFTNDHPFNQAFWYLRNRVLVWAVSTWYFKLIFFLPVLYGALSMLVTKMHRKIFYPLIVFAVLYVFPSWMIEIRYHFIPLILYLLFKKETPRLGWITTGYFIVLGLFFMYGLANWWFFL